MASGDASYNTKVSCKKTCLVNLCLAKRHDISTCLAYSMYRHDFVHKYRHVSTLSSSEVYFPKTSFLQCLFCMSLTREEIKGEKRVIAEEESEKEFKSNTYLRKLSHDNDIYGNS